MDQRLSLVSPRERVVSATVAMIIVALLGLALVWGLGVRLPERTTDALTMLDLRVPPPPAPIPPPPVEHPMTRRAKHAPAPPNIRSRATPVVAWPLPLRPTPIVAAKIAGVGAAPTAGASDRAGPGTGAGGEGNGDGGGGDGDGDGEVPPRLTHGRIAPSDLPKDLRQGETEVAIAIDYRVRLDGRADDCHIRKTTGNTSLDSIVCRLVESRFQFKPAEDLNGNPVTSRQIDTYQWSFDRGIAPSQP